MVLKNIFLPLQQQPCLYENRPISMISCFKWELYLNLFYFYSQYCIFLCIQSCLLHCELLLSKLKGCEICYDATRVSYIVTLAVFDGIAPFSTEPSRKPYFTRFWMLLHFKNIKTNCLMICSTENTQENCIQKYNISSVFYKVM